jgi:HSP20 family protein
MEVLKDMNRLFDRVLQPAQQEGNGLETGHWLPSVDIRETDKNYLLKADLPGVDSNNIQIYMEAGALVIKGERKEEHEEKEQNYSRVERLQGSFYRRFTLPDNADSDNIEAEMDSGVLTVTIPKKQAQQSHGQQIQIKHKK